MSFAFTAEEVQTVAKVAAGDVDLEHFLRAALYLENRSAGRVLYSAVSPKGAVGPYQIIKKTWEDGLAMGYAAPNADRQNLHDSAVFVKAMYQREYLPAFGKGNFAPMLVAYNQSPALARKYDKNRKLNMGRETNDYVRDYLAMFDPSKRVTGFDVSDPSLVKGIQILVRPRFESLPVDGKWGKLTANAYAQTVTSPDALRGASLDRLVRSGAVSSDSDGYVVILSDGFQIQVKV